MNSEKLYQFITNPDPSNFQDKSILIIGGGWMANQYASALHAMNIKDVTISSRTKEKTVKLCDDFKFKPFLEGIEKSLSTKTFDLVIIATSVNSLIPIAKSALENGQTNILIEKPGSLYSEKLSSFAKTLDSQIVKIAYNRLMYPNLLKLKQLTQEEGGITSCRFTFTEWVHTIDFKKEPPETYQRWGIANSLHVISMALNMIGMPKELSAHRIGKLDWHPTGSIFVGSGVTELDIPFSYHADWKSSGRWGIEVMTEKNAYRLIPLEELYVCHKGSTTWEKIQFPHAFPEAKHGIAEEIAVMLNEEMQKELVSLENGSKLIEIAEKIFGYNS